MTDQGFRKFRRRRSKREETPAQDTARPVPQKAAAPQDKADDVAPVKPVRPVRPVRPETSVVQSTERPAVQATDRPSKNKPKAGAPAQPATAAPRHAEAGARRDADTLDALQDRSRGFAEARPDPLEWTVKQTSEPQDIVQSSEPEQKLPAHLPDPWHVMRRVEVTGLSEHRSRLPLVDFFRQSPTARAFDLLRTRLLHTLRAQGWTRVAICGPTPGCGASFTAANLALSLARVPESRTVLMDLNMRTPGVAAALGLERAALYNGDMLGFLRGELRLDEHFVAASNRLALGLSTSVFHNSAEVLHDSRCAATIDEVIRRTRANVALFDLPSVLHSDDVAAFLPQVDGVLLVSDGSETTARHLKACEKMLAGHTQLLGVVLNRARNDEEFTSAS
ncbi:Mrp family chromosome partitioning ATPase [Tritonibacter scottomollicae]|uniref:Mrp family chromosome partitioning ATPase n=1 Tax=Tritonibacter scottomollicae TaxID=483013 RepID=A0A2T1ANT3_TRISK|nr:Mrp family chromosome partitioning ATPase [Tritonibacter scottomollicae]